MKLSLFALVTAMALFNHTVAFAAEEENRGVAESAPAKADAAKTDKKAEASPQFSGEQAKIKEIMENLFEASKHVNKPKEKKEASRGQIESALDWDRVAQECMGKQWKKQTEANRAQFKKVLKDVVVKTAYSRMDTFWDNASYKFEYIKIKGTEAQVKTRFKVKADTFILEYYLHNKGGKWLVHDIAYEDIRYSVNIREQVEGFLREKSFASLMDKLKKRRDELDKDAAPSKS